MACHERESGKIIHRDIKPGNIFLDDCLNVKLGDFGLSRIMGEDSLYAYTHVGTPYYMSPEQFTDSKYNEKSDIWSAGCLIYEAASSHPPFQARSQTELARKIKSGVFERIPIRFSQELQNVIGSMLTLDYQRRPSIQDILKIPFISMRLKENKLKDTVAKLKQEEEQLKERDDKSLRLRNNLKEKEKRLQAKEICIDKRNETNLEKFKRGDSLSKNCDKNKLKRNSDIEIENCEIIANSPRRALAVISVIQNSNNQSLCNRVGKLRSKSRPRDNIESIETLRKICRHATCDDKPSTIDSYEMIATDFSIHKITEISKDCSEVTEKDYYSFDNILKRYERVKNEDKRLIRHISPYSKPPRKEPK